MRMLFCLVLACVVSLGAAPKTESTIAVNPSSQLYLGGAVTFDVAYDQPKGNNVSSVYIRIDCYAANGALIWATSGLAQSEFVLGDFDPQSGTYFWNLPPYDVVPAHCSGSLYYFKNGRYQYLARVEFDAATAPAGV